MPRSLAFPILVAALAGLLDIATERGQETVEGIALGVKKTQIELAGLAGEARETVRETLLDSRRRGLLAVHGRSILLTDPAVLCALAAGATRRAP